jgi:tRNA (cytosine38-C5)-methyltransferase
MKAVEFFSGIGGWSFTLDNTDSCHKVVAAYDINPSANEAYAHNFNRKVRTRPLDTITAYELDLLSAELWMMSPPCQPHTRANSTEKRDLKDPRSAAFLNIIAQLNLITCLPRYIILENVVGFEESACCASFLQTLSRRGFSYEQFIVCPTSMGIPNSRPRYYCLAWLASESDAASSSSGIQRSLPGKTVEERWSLERFLDPPSTNMDAYAIPLEYIQTHLRSCWCWDIVHRDSKVTACFTKAYARYHTGSGSVLLDLRAGSSDYSSSISNSSVSFEAGSRVFNEQWLDALLDSHSELYLRYLSPSELLRLFGFHVSFTFPDGLSNRQCYALVGNSINVTVASHLLRHLLGHTTV